MMPLLWDETDNFITKRLIYQPKYQIGVPFEREVIDRIDTL
jgi:hypothetical protein